MSAETIYISYSRDNSEFVVNLATTLREEGVNIWLDQLDIKAGERWDDSIEKALHASETFLIVLSKASIASHNVMDELSYALGANKKVITVLLEACEIPLRLRRLQYVDFTTNHSIGLKHLVKLLAFKTNKIDEASNSDEVGCSEEDGVFASYSAPPSPTSAIPPKNSRPRFPTFRLPSLGSLSSSSSSSSRDAIFPSVLREQKQEDKKELSVTVYAPPTFVRGESQFIQIWMFLPEFEKEVKERALSYDDEASKLGYENILVPIQYGSEIALTLSSKDIQFSEQKSFTWLGKISSKNFSVEIPSDLKIEKLNFTLEVYIDGLIVGEIIFLIKSRNKFLSGVKTLLGNTDSIPKPIGDTSKRYKKAFISYASEDRSEVLARVQGIAATKVYEIFQDIMDLEPGERWEKRLYKEIDLCDVFFLCWSVASSKSEWVLKELEYAIQINMENKEFPIKIQPIIIPPIVKPPEQLGHLHFNDKIVQFIIAEKQIRETNKKN